MIKSAYIRILATTGSSFVPDYDNYAIQTLDPNEPNYNPAAAIILNSHNVGTVIKRPVIPNGGKYYLTKDEAADVTGIWDWFYNKNVVSDTNCIVTSAGSSYNFEYFNEFVYFTSVSVIGYKINQYFQNNYGFAKCKKLREITLPTSVHYLYGSSNVAYPSCFAECELLSSINLNNITSMTGAGIFRGCNYLNNVNISGVTSIPEYAFGGCIRLKNITLNQNTTTIDNGAFTNTGTSASYSAGDTFDLNLPSLSWIGYYAFQKCKFLTSITSLGKITSTHVGNITNGGIFEECTRLTSVDISNITTIGHRTFYGDVELHNITFSSSLVNIYTNAFGFCPKLYIQSLPSSIRHIGVFAFNYTGAQLSSSEQYKLTIDLPNLGYLGEGAFQTSMLLKEVVNLGTINNLSKGVFSYCSATLIIVPNTVTEIYPESLAHLHNCVIHFLSDTPAHINNLNFHQLSQNCMLYVGDGSSAAHDDAILNTYLADSIWNMYASEMDTWYNYLNP